MSASISTWARLAAAAFCLSACAEREPHLGGQGDADAAVANPDAGPDDAGDAGDRRDGAAALGPACRVGGTSADVPTTIGCAQTFTGRLIIAGDYVYWTVQGAGPIAWRAPLAGGSPEPLVYDTTGAFGLVIDPTYVYYTQPASGRVMRLPLAGGAPIPLAHSKEPIFLVSDGSSLYWTDSEDDGKIIKLDLVDGAQPITLIDGQTKPRSIAVGGGWVYWTDVMDGTVLRTLDHLTGPADAAVRVASRLASGLKVPSDLFLLGDYAYVPDQRGSVQRVPLEGGDLETVAQIEGIPYGIATDGTSIYWTTQGLSGDVFRAPLDGAGMIPPTRIVGGQADPRFVAVTRDNVFWTTWGAHPAVRKLAK
jgi:hypothetical protein